MLGALQLQQGIREMLVLLCSPFFFLIQSRHFLYSEGLPYLVFSENISLTCLEVYFLGDAESCQVDNGDEPSFTVKMKILSLGLRKGILCNGSG